MSLPRVIAVTRTPSACEREMLEKPEGKGDSLRAFLFPNLSLTSGYLKRWPISAASISS